VNLFARLKLPTALGEPELGRNLRIDEGFEDLSNRPAESICAFTIGAFSVPMIYLPC
jgi:hypothetical protein